MEKEWRAMRRDKEIATDSELPPASSSSHRRRRPPWELLAASPPCPHDDDDDNDDDDEEEEEEEEERLRKKEIRLARDRESQRVGKRARASRMAEASKEEMKEVLKVMEPLPERISDLLRSERGHALSFLAQRGFVFMETELSTIVAALRQLLASAELIGSDHVDSHTMNRLAYLTDLARWIGDLIDGYAPHQTETELREQNLAWIEQLLLVLRTPPHDDVDDDPRLTQSYAAAASLRLVGVDGPRKKLATWLMEDDGDGRLKVLSIVGPAGVGKTTLAMEVFRKVEGQFQCRAAAKVFRRPPDTRKLLRHIMSQIIDSAALVSSECSQTMTALEGDEYELAYDIKQYLRDKRYLIVIDELWKISDWELIWDAFPGNSCHSRIIITTRIRSVARSCCSHPWSDGLVHEVRPLSELDSKRLFSANAFGSEHSCPSDHFAQVSDEILRRCDGIPLSIIAMAGLMKQGREVVDSSAVYWLGKIPKLKQVEEALSPSYDDLPCKLKLLSLYMSTFLQGYMIDKHRLIRKWKAEGLIAIHTLREFEDIAEEYFSELVQRDIIRPVKTCKYSSEVNTCNYQVNQFMLQFLVSKSAQQNFVTTCTTLNSGATVNETQIRRVFLHQPGPDIRTLLEKMDLSRTRSLTVSGATNQIPLDVFIHLVVLDLEGWERLKDEHLLQMCKSGKLFLLKYLSLRNTRVSELPPEIDQLSSLETLDVSHTQISELPSQVCQLRALEALDLRRTQIRHLPEQIVDLPALRHLLISCDETNPDTTVTKIPNRISCVTYLETLATVDLSEWSADFVADLGNLPYLEVLAVTWSFHQCTDEEYQKALRSLVQRSWSLKSLTIRCEFGCSMEFLDSLSDASPQDLHNIIITARFLTVPKWIQGLKHLVFLEITVCKLAPDDIKILGSLQRLECLLLGLDFLPKEAIVIESEGYSPQKESEDTEGYSPQKESEDTKGFRRLLRFSVDCRVPWLGFRRGAMRRLTDLDLKLSTGPASQESVPSGIANLLSLEQVTLRYDPWYINSRSVKATVGAMRRQVAELQYTVKLVNNSVEEDVEAILAETAGTAEATQTEIGGEAGSDGSHAAVERATRQLRFPDPSCSVSVERAQGKRPVD